MTQPTPALKAEGPAGRDRVAARRHDLDALRAAAMLLGIVYHAALSFALGLPWLVQDASQSRALFVFQAAGHGFRMQLFFLISGFFTAMLWRKKGTRALLWHRFRRVLLPCLLGLVTVVPAMSWAGGLAASSNLTRNRAKALAEPASANLWAAIRHGDLDAVRRRLIDSRVLTTPHPAFGVTPLSWAALEGQRDIAAALLAQGADVNARNRDGGTALHAAAFLGRADVAELLLDKGADVNARGGSGETPSEAAAADWGVVQFLGGLLSLDVEESAVNAGREQILRRLKREEAVAVGAKPALAPPAVVGNAPPRSPSFGERLNRWTDTPVFVLVWFLWFLWWLVVVFSCVAPAAAKLGFRLKARWVCLSPAKWAWLVPITAIPQWFMSSGRGEFGPDTSMGIVPMPHVFAYYALFFFFGALYEVCADDDGRVGRHWRWTLPVTLLVVFPIGLELATGTFYGLNGRLNPQLARVGSVVFQAAYAWMMSFAAMGLFRSLVVVENRTLRYLSDSSYWLYLAHLPLVIAAQVLIRDWPGPSGVKLALLSLSMTAFLVLTYQVLVRHTWIGWLLNGRRSRAGNPAQGSA